MGPKLKEGIKGLIQLGQSNLNEHNKVNIQLAERSFDLRTSGLWAQHASTAPLCCRLVLYQFCSLFGCNKPRANQKVFVRSGIRTHAHRSGLRPERSALDLSAILTWSCRGRIGNMQRPSTSEPKYLGDVEVRRKVGSILSNPR